MNKKLLVAIALALPAVASAQEQAPIAGTLVPEVDDSNWSLGLGVAVSDSPYAGEGTKVSPLPFVVYEGETFFWRGVSGGYHAFDNGVFSLDAIAALRADGFDIDDLGDAELRANGLDPALLEDRDFGLDLGVDARWRGDLGELRLQAVHDVSDASGGQEVSLDYGYRILWGRTAITPGIGVKWLSEDSMQYYYGTLDEEEARGVASYRPDAAIVPEVRINIARKLGEKWGLFGTVQYKFLPDDITDSPFIEPDTDGSASIVIGFARSF